MKTVLDVLYGWLLTTAACTAAGLYLTYLLGLRLKRLERILLSFLTGAAGLSVLIFTLCALHLARRGLLQVVAIMLIALGIWAWRKAPPDADDGPRRGWNCLWVAGFGLYAFVYFFNALAPEVSPDGMAYHLEVVGAFERARGFASVPPTTFSFLPQATELLFLFAYEFGHNSAAAMLHFSFLLALPWLGWCFGRRFDMPEAGAFGGLLAFTSPIAGIAGISAYNDVALAAAAFGVFYLLQIWRETEQSGVLAAAGLLAGFCAATKYTGALVPVYLLCYVGWNRRSTLAAAIRSAAIAAIPAGLVVVPWYVRNWLATGNPTLPLLSRWFQNPYVSPIIEDAMRGMALAGSYGVGRWWGLWEAVVNGRNPGMIGPVFLAAPLALLAVRNPMGRRLLIAAAVLLGAFVLNSDTRFLIPALVFIAIPMGVALRRLRQNLAVLGALHLILCWYTIIPLYGAPQWCIREVPIRAALRIVPETDFFARRAPEYFLARVIDANTPPGSTVFTMAKLPQAYTSRTIRVAFQDSISYDLLTWLMRAYSPRPVEECRYEFAPRDALGLKLVQDRANDWRIDELRFLNGGTELMREPRWRLRGSPNSPGVALAFDNNPLTFWWPADPGHAGAWVEAQFGVASRIGTVVSSEMEGSGGMPRVRLLDPRAGWQSVKSTRTCAAVGPRPSLRRLAIEEFQARGVGYLAIPDEEPIARDLQYNCAAWGIVEIAEYGGTRLYLIRGQATQSPIR